MNCTESDTAYILLTQVCLGHQTVNEMIAVTTLQVELHTPHTMLGSPNA